MTNKQLAQICRDALETLGIAKDENWSPEEKQLFTQALSACEYILNEDKNKYPYKKEEDDEEECDCDEICEAGEYFEERINDLQKEIEELNRQMMCISKCFQQNLNAINTNFNTLHNRVENLEAINSATTIANTGLKTPIVKKPRKKKK